MWGRRCICALSCALALGCGERRGESEARGHETAAAPSSEAHASQETPADEAPRADPPAQPAPDPTPVDLLHAVPATVAVSSVYHDDRDQIARIADGDLSTAWNSRTGDLEGAFVEVQLPADVSVTSIELTAGFTREGGRTDLFAGNQRISRIRITHGESITEHDLDTESRALQSVPVHGGGGTYRVEIVRLLAGSRPDWREVCISELRVVGTPGASGAGASTPTFTVADASTSPMTEGAAADPQDPVDRAFLAVLHFEDELTPAERWRDSEESLALMEAEVQPLVDTANDAEVRCEWADARLEARADRVMAHLEDARRRADDAWANDGERETDDVRAHEAEARAAERAADALPEMLDAESRVAGARRVLDAAPPAVPSIASEWNTLRARAQEVVDSCAGLPAP